MFSAESFGVAGFVGIVVTDGLADLLRYHAGQGRLSSAAIAIMIAAAVTFAGNRYWTYRHRERTGLRRESALFFGVNGIGVDITEVPVVLTYRSTWTAASPTTSPSTAASRPLPFSATGRTRNGYGGQIQRPL
jgi:putative flippase GtrA